MVNARLHLICGNCGCNNQWKWRYNPPSGDGEDDDPATVYIICENCATLHNLGDNAIVDE